MNDTYQLSISRTPADDSDLSAFSGKALNIRKLGMWGTIGRMAEPENPYRQELVHTRHVFVFWEAEIRHGAADFLVNGRRILRPGKALGSVDFRPAGVEFIANVHQSAQSQRTVLTIDETELARSSITFEPVSDLVPMMTERNNFLVALLRHISNAAQTPDLNSTYIEALALTCLLEARNLSLKHMARQHQPSPKSGLSAFHAKQLAHYIDEYLSTDIHLIDLANLIGLSPYYFSRSFSATFGVSPYQYILTRRIERAKEMMLKRDANLLDIAISVGFAGSSQFSRTFKKITGTTPSHWLGKNVAPIQNHTPACNSSLKFQTGAQRR